MNTSAKKIRAIRKKWGLTQQQLADHARISRSLLAMAETGKRRLKKSVLEYIYQYKAVVFRSPALDDLLQSQQQYIENHRGAKSYEASEEIAQKTQLLSRMKWQFHTRLTEWSRLTYLSQWLHTIRKPASAEHIAKKLEKLSGQLEKCDLIAQYRLQRELIVLQALKTSEPLNSDRYTNYQSAFNLNDGFA